MKAVQFVKTIVYCSLLSIACHTALAGNTSEVECPDAEHLKHFHLIYASPHDFDPQLKLAKFAVEAEEGNWITGFEDGFWLLSSISIPAGQSEDIQTVWRATLEKLTPVSPSPFQHEITVLGDIQIDNAVCIYTLPDNDTVSVMATFFKGFNSGDNDYPAKKQAIVAEHRQRLMQIK